MPKKMKDKPKKTKGYNEGGKVMKYGPKPQKAKARGGGAATRGTSYTKR